VASRREVVLYPDESRTVELTLSDQANYVAVAANLRDPEPDAWRRVFPVDEVKGERLLVQVNAQTLDVTIE
jgi:type VI secretion system VasD/TssJ family lipoprotein